MGWGRGKRDREGGRGANKRWCVREGSVNHNAVKKSEVEKYNDNSNN